MKDGATAAAHVLAYARRDPVGAADALADVMPEPVPPCAALATHVFETLSATRGSGMTGPRPLTITDISSVSAVLGLPITPRDARWVLHMDAAFCDEAAKLQESPS